YQAEDGIRGWSVSGVQTCALPISVIGDVAARLLEAAGYEVEREYYVNDAGRQMDVLGRSTLTRYRQLAGHDVALPEDAYPGEYQIGRASWRERGERAVGTGSLR